MKHVKTKTEEATYRTCDICPESKGRIKPCYGCGKDACEVCSTWLHLDPFDGTDNYDSPDRICSSCRQELPVFESSAAGARDIWETQITKLKHNWRKACLRKLAGTGGEK